eukprot:TRINITY_DN3121_c4_g7_i1.p1 TRINITY_DN3121_c4_g7~~TRINITY_DN3121_c4_g7_i1.p1  ORF type:complete len:445 (+),score=119.20 TRINITY_DN3121_c4_g7_i1:27-1361(+)
MVSIGKFLIISCVLIVISAKTAFNVMMPLDTVNIHGDLGYGEDTIGSWFKRLHDINVDGVMLDVWWGIVETAPKQYNFKPYMKILELAKQNNIKVQFVASFHTCGDNNGDGVKIGLPGWVEAIGKVNPDIYYKDQWGNPDPEYLSLGIDEKPILNGRTPVQVYANYVAELLNQAKDYLSNTLNEIQVGLGPCGELRYPSYQLSRWNFPGIGAFQCWDKYMMADFQSKAKAVNPDWNSPPTDAGNYNSMPWETSFFRDGYKSEYGLFFLKWYSQSLIDHAMRILSTISAVPGMGKVDMAFKISGIHWQYNTPSHAAELTAGYYNTNGNDAYALIVNQLARLPVVVDFTCLEMTDNEQANSCSRNGQNLCAPEELVHQVHAATCNKGLRFAGENAIERWDDGAFKNTINQANGYCKTNAVTWLRLDDNLFNNFDRVKYYVAQFHNV